MLKAHWQPDETQEKVWNLHLTFPNGHNGHLWIAPRQPYCDRGHWEWAFLGSPPEPYSHCRPSHYFMDGAVAMHELETWLHRMCLSEEQRDAEYQNTVFTPPVNEHGDTDIRWIMLQPHQWQCTWIGERGVQASLLVTQAKSETGPVWWVEPVLPEMPTHPEKMANYWTHPLSSLDESDAFPRLYFSPQSVGRECAAFLRWRGAKQPLGTPTEREKGMKAHGLALGDRAVLGRPSQGYRRC